MESLKKSADEHKKVSIPSNSLQCHDKYIERLKTFDVTLIFLIRNSNSSKLFIIKLCKWFAKPKSYSPIECAKHGWYNYSQNTLKCVSCANLFYVYTPKHQKLNKSIMMI
jgi:hypothetical protein